MSEKQKCLDIINNELNEINARQHFVEVMSEVDFAKLQVLLIVYTKIEEQV